MYEEREREREEKRGKERTKRQRGGGGGENRGGRDGSKVEVKKRSERKGVVGKIHLFEKRYRVTSNARPSLPFHIFLSFASHFLLSICVRALPSSIYFCFSFSILLLAPSVPPRAPRWTRAADFTGCRAEFGRRIFSLEMVNWACAGANERLPGAISSFFFASRPRLVLLLASLTLHHAGPP